MKPPLRLSWTSVLAAAFALPAVALPIFTLEALAGLPQGVTPTQTRTPGRDARLLALLDRFYDLICQADPVGASTRGDLRFNDRLPDVGPEALAAQRAEAAAILNEVRKLDRAALRGEDLIDADLLEYTLDLGERGSKFLPEQMPINALEGPHISLPQMYLQLPLATEQQVADYVARLEKIPTLIDQQIANMRAGMKVGRVPPRVILAETVTGIRAHCTPEIAARPSTSPFYTPLRIRADADPLAARAGKAIASGIVPAFERLAAFMESEYLPACRDSIGASEGVDGIGFYEHQLRSHTTTALTAQQIHDIGLAEVARIKAEMMRVIDETDWADKGKYADPSQSEQRFAQFVAYLRKEPRFYFKSEQEMLDGYRAIGKRIDPELVGLFATLPRLPWGIRPIPRFAAPSSPAAYYYPGSTKSGVPGYFMVNTYDLNQRPKYGMISLTLHEAVPGHHFQGAIADEIPTQHPYRSAMWYTAHGEGWALYAESLGLEMGDDPRSTTNPNGRGLYGDPYDYFGRLSDEIWRACRLVVDTGMHAFGWSRQRAIDYMLANSAGTELDTVSEIDRYIGWPGQACAYKLGEIRIHALRERASRTLGPAFDKRLFHDELLNAGSIPLAVLEKRIDRWIENRSRKDNAAR
ncbi:MAG TPA: DUF885 domain-containing protein [Phycisphaerales bacterium]